MKSEPKVFASLSSGLLARKGAARPAMRPQGFGQGGGALEDLGWDDMGFEPPKPAAAPRDETHDAFGAELEEQPLRNPLAALTPVQSPVHSQQAEIAGRLQVPDEELSEEGEEIDETAELYEPEADTAEAQTAVAEAPEARMPEPQDVPPVVVELTPARAPVARRAPAPRSAPGSKAKAAFTLRLDPERHLKLRLACAVSGRSAQLLVTDALDTLLGSMPELDAMALKANRKG
ncbi:MAG TPA: hypothetical protein VFU20_03630 [Sphingomicrobium sp.]|nr:hypothetical protein [Sphingomicrobium sp.]